MDFRSISVSFHIPWQSPLYRSKPASFLGHLVGHEAPGSIHSYLKGKGWSTGVSAGNSSQGRGFTKFGIQVFLTKEGFGTWY
jgi:insulysin